MPLKRILRGLRITAYWKLAAVIVLVILAATVLLCTKNYLSARSRPVEFGLRNIGEFATQAGYYTNVQVIEDSQKFFGYNIPFTQSKYIFSYDGVIKAGVDFEDIAIAVDEVKKTVTVTIPGVKITSNEIDQGSLEVYDEKKSIFTPLSISDVNMSMTELKAEAEETAVGNGILENARSNAELLITGFLAAQFDPSEYEYIYE